MTLTGPAAFAGRLVPITAVPRWAALRRIRTLTRKEGDVGALWADLPLDRVPPCVFERAGFMRPESYSIVRSHPYAGGWTKSHAHFADTVHYMPAYSVEATPFRWVMRDKVPEIARTWGIGYAPELG